MKITVRHEKDEILNKTGCDIKLNVYTNSYARKTVELGQTFETDCQGLQLRFEVDDVHCDMNFTSAEAEVLLDKIEEVVRPNVD